MLIPCLLIWWRKQSELHSDTSTFSELFLLAYQFPVLEKWLSWQWCWNIQSLTYRSRLCHLSDSPSQRCWSYWAQTWQRYVSEQHSVTCASMKVLGVNNISRSLRFKDSSENMAPATGKHPAGRKRMLYNNWLNVFIDVSHLFFFLLTTGLFTGWNTNQRRTTAPREPTARSTKSSSFMSIVPWILRPKYCKPGAKSAAAILWKTDGEKHESLSKCHNDNCLEGKFNKKKRFLFDKKTINYKKTIKIQR